MTNWAMVIEGKITFTRISLEHGMKPEKIRLTCTSRLLGGAGVS